MGRASWLECMRCVFESHDYFQKVYSSEPHHFTKPSWMPAPAPPQYPMGMDPISMEELSLAIKRSRPSSSPSPIDQISYRVFKQCHLLRPAILDLFNTILSSGEIPSGWKTAVFKLIAKSSAKDDPHSPANFRPIALTSTISKLFSGILKDRWLRHMTANGYLDADIQKAFIPTIPGVTEHQTKLAAIINEARESKRSLAVAWIDIANAYGSIHHSLINFALSHYHAPPALCHLLHSWYSGLSATVSTPDWVSPAVPLEMGVYQGDPLSVAIFLTVMSTLTDTLNTRQDLGAVSPNSESPVNHLLYADDTCIVSSSPAACQHLLDMVQQWLIWAKLEAKPSKSRALCIKASLGKAYDPQLSIAGKHIPIVGDSYFKFLGMPIRVPPHPNAAKSSLVSSLKRMLCAIDNAPVTRHQQLRLYKQGVCPRLTWPLLINNFAITFLEREIDPLATHYLKKWSGLAKPANPSLLYLPPRRGGLGLPSLSGLYKKQQASRSIQLLLSRDSSVRQIAYHQQHVENCRQRQKFQPFNTAQLVLDAQSSNPRPQAMVKRVRSFVAAEEEEERISNLQGLPCQGEMIRRFEATAGAIWAKCIANLPPEPVKFVLNAAVDTLPTNKNLHKWKKRPSATCALCKQGSQSLLHVLNDCSKAMSLRRYSVRHDDVLQICSEFVSKHLPPSFNLTVDLPNKEYAFPHHITPTTLRPDVVWWSEEKKVLRILELTVSFETVMDQAHERKMAKYDELLGRVRRAGYAVECIALEVGSRGLVCIDKLQPLRDTLNTTGKAITNLALSLSRCAILGSFKIWCTRNHLSE